MNNNGPPRRPPRRFKSSSTAGSNILLDDISEVDVFRAPLRTKSCDQLEAELLVLHNNNNNDDDDDPSIPAQIDLSALAQNLHKIQLRTDYNKGDHDHDNVDDDDDDDDMWDGEFDNDLDNEDSSDEDNKDMRRGENRHKHYNNNNNLGRTHSFVSTGSNMTAQQMREPGRFVTPASSFYNNNNNNNNTQPMMDCVSVERAERATVDPYQFMSADLSFRLPLVGSLTDDNFVVPKKAKLQDDNDAKMPTVGGRKTIQLNDADTAGMPKLGLDSASEDEETTPAPANEREEEEHEPTHSKPIMFGKLKRESRRLLRPNLPFS